MHAFESQILPEIAAIAHQMLLYRCNISTLRPVFIHSSGVTLTDALNLLECIRFMHVLFLFLLLQDVQEEEEAKPHRQMSAAGNFASCSAEMKSGVFQLHKSAVIIIIMSCFKSP